MKGFLKKKYNAQNIVVVFRKFVELHVQHPLDNTLQKQQAFFFLFIAQYSCPTQLGPRETNLDHEVNGRANLQWP